MRLARLSDVRARQLRRAAVVAAAFALFLYTTVFHEFWRDEAQTALIARAVPLADLVPAMRREAVPPVVFLVLKAVGVLPPPYSLGALGAIGFASLLLGTYELLLTICGSPRRSAAATAAFAFTDTYCYELGVVVRQYGLGLGFALACVAYLARAIVSEERRDARLGAAFGALAVSTSVHPGCLAGSALLAYSAIRFARQRTVRTIVQPLSTLPAFLFTFFLIMPYDRTPEGVGVFHRNLRGTIELARTLLLDGALCHGWWTRQDLEALKAVIVGLAAASLVGLVVSRGASMRRSLNLTAFYAATFALNALTLMYIFVVRYPGSYRHHLFLVMPMMVAAVGWICSPGERQGFSQMDRWGSAALLGPWFLFQYWTAGTDLMGDVRGAFSGTKAAAAALPPDARVVVAGNDWMASGILYWRPDVSMRAQSSLGRPFRYLLQDWEWHRQVPLAPLLAEECSNVSNVFVLAAADAPPSDNQCMAYVSTPSSLLPTEHFSVFDLRCRCFAERPRGQAP